MVHHMRVGPGVFPALKSVGGQFLAQAYVVTMVYNCSRMLRSRNSNISGHETKESFQDLLPSHKASETLIRGNSKFVCFSRQSDGGGILAVILATQFGRQPDEMLLAAHKGGIMDFEFSPFDDHLLLSASEDKTICLWKLPSEGLKPRLKEPELTLQGHAGKVSLSTFNPCASNVVASTGFDSTCKVWHLTSQKACFSIKVPDRTMHIKWNYTGSLLAVTCKDKKLHIVDPRQSKMTAACKICDGPKPTKVEWLGSPSWEDVNMFVTTGFSLHGQRQIHLWDMRKLPADGREGVVAMYSDYVDDECGVLYPYFDPGTQILYTAGKGDSKVSLYEVTNSDRCLLPLQAFQTASPQKGFDFLPKRCVDVSVHEVMRGLKLKATSIQPVSFRVELQSEDFQEDIFMYCPAGIPNMNADQWVSGQDCTL
ncbi:CRN1 [Symbiodinium natans]|uniref:Coronin n=1 Tax=Symbiodinium natans TaxID=878477 RepID=A0A812K6D3_9DINO|nr:CRN1 [Symbiodinium natans]